MQQVTTFVGLDTSKEFIDVCVLRPDREGAIQWREPNQAKAVKRLIKRLKGEAVLGDLVVC